MPAQKDDAQLSLKLETQVVEQEQTVVKQTVSYQKTVRQADRKSPVRQGLPDHIARIDVVIEPEEDVSTMRKIGEKVTEELDLEPARLGDPVCSCAGISAPGM